MTGTMNNARQLYLAGYQMALDGGTNSDGNRAWPGDYAGGISTPSNSIANGLSKMTLSKAVMPRKF